MVDPSDSQAAKLMSAALDEALDVNDAQAFEALMEADLAAQEEFSQLRDMLALVKDLPEVEAPPDFYEKVARKIRRRKLLSGEFWLLVSLPFQVLSVVIVLVIAVIYMMVQLERDPAVLLERESMSVPSNSAPEASPDPESDPKPD